MLAWSCLTASLSAQLFNHWENAPELPMRISNNAVASLVINDTCFVFSFMGIDSTKIWSGITRNAYRLNTTTGVWSSIAPVPGNVGRIAASAQGLHGKVYIFGGYSVNANGSEVTWENVDIYDPVTDTYTLGTPIPVKVDDQVTAVWRDSLIFLISGWSTNHNVTNVQIYNPVTDSWQQATPIIGPPVFGHAGTIVGDTIIYADGVKVSGFNFVMSKASYRGIINPSNPTMITWNKLPRHPGAAKYRMAAGYFGRRVIFAGGTDNPYNFNGIGYNGQPSEPDSMVFAYNTRTQNWELLTPNTHPTMDHRGLVNCGNRLYLIGGMASEQQVRKQVDMMVIDSLVPINEEVGIHHTPKVDAAITNYGEFRSPGANTPNFQWNGLEMLAEGVILMALPPDRIVEGASLISGNSISDFRPIYNLIRLADNTDSTVFRVDFNDSRAPQSIGLQFRQISRSYTTSQHAGYLLVDLTITNLSGAPLDSLLVGGFFNWDVPDPTNNTGAVIFDTVLVHSAGVDSTITAEFAYIYDAGSPTAYLGSIPLSQFTFQASRIADNAQEVLPGGMPLSDSAKYQYMLERRNTEPFGDPFGPADKSLFFALGGMLTDGSPDGGFYLANGDSIRVGFALVGGNNLDDFVSNGKAVIRRWWRDYGPLVGVDLPRNDNSLREFELMQNYPNPFNPLTIINYQLSIENWVTLKVYDVLGREIRTLVNGRQRPGKYRVEWNGRNDIGESVSSGIYFYRLKVGNFQVTRKMVLLR